MATIWTDWPGTACRITDAKFPGKNGGMDTPEDQTEYAVTEPAHESQRSLVTVLASDANQVVLTAAKFAAVYGTKKALDRLDKPAPAEPSQPEVTSPEPQA